MSTLREFDLDFPTAERWVRARLRNESRSSCALYERHFEPIRGTEGFRLIVDCVPTITRAEVVCPLGVFAMQVERDVSAFASLDVEPRKKAFVDTLHEGATEVARRKGWALAPFEAARAAVARLAYVNEWRWPKHARQSPARSRLAVLRCRHDVDRFRADLVVTDRKGVELAREPALDEMPSEHVFVPKLGRLQWSSEEQVALLDRGGAVVCTISLTRS